MRTGRPIKLTPEIHREVVDLVREGNYLDTAAAHVGISRGTIHAWIRRGRRLQEGPDWTQYGAEDRAFLDFSIAIRRAKAESEAGDLGAIRASVDRNGFPDWRARAWILERKNPERWGRRDTIAVGRAPDTVGRDDLDVSKLDDRQLDALIDALEAGIRAEEDGDVDPEGGTDGT